MARPVRTSSNPEHKVPCIGRKRSILPSSRSRAWPACGEGFDRTRRRHSYLLVERYDRVTDRRRVRRIHQEDLCQANGFPPYLKYEWNKDVAQPGPGLKHCMDALIQTSAAGLSKLRFLDMMLFNVLCGNVDAHAKNYSILIRPGEVSMAPIYDVMNGDIYPGVTRNLAMKIAKKQRGAHIHGRHWDKFSEENGLSATAVRRRVAELSAATLKALPGVVKEMEASDLKSSVYTEIAEYVTYYCRQMISNLKTDPPPDDDEIEDYPSTPDEPSEEILISPWFSGLLPVAFRYSLAFQKTDQEFGGRILGRGLRPSN